MPSLRPTLRTLLLALLGLTLALTTSGSPLALPAKARLERVSDTDLPLVEATRTYLVTLDRSVSYAAKDVVLDKLMRANAVIKQVYDYRVYKGVLFSVPIQKDKGLAEWSDRLKVLEGVKAIEEDQVVRTN